MSYITFAQWFGIISLALSLGILLNLRNAKEMAKHMIQTETGYIMGAVLPITFGSLAFLNLSTFHFDQQMIVSLIGLAIFFLGCYRAFFPKHWSKVLSKHIDQIPSLFSLFGLMFGIALTYIGFIAHAIR